MTLSTELLMRALAMILGAAAGSYFTVPFARRAGVYRTLKIVTTYLDRKIERAGASAAGRVEAAGYVAVRREVVHVVMDELSASSRARRAIARD